MAMDLTGRIIGAESGGNPLARNPRSSAGGLGQFLNSTWLSTIRKHRPDLAGRSNNELLQLKFDPSLSKAMTAAYAADNQGFLKSKGIDPTPGNTYLAHFAGPQGAAAIHGNPSASAEQLLGARAVAANPFLRGKTGADVINWATGKVGGAPTSSNQVANGAPMATPIGGAPIAGGPVPLQAPSERRSKLADMLLAQAAGAKVSGWGDALRAAGGAALGYTMGEKADKQQGEYRSKLAEMLSGASNENLPQTLLGSGDKDLMKQGVAMRVAQAKPQSKSERFMPTANGIMDLNTMQMVPGTAKEAADDTITMNGRILKRSPEGKYEEVYVAPPAKPKLEVADRKEIFEADEGAQAATNVMSSLDKAIGLNDKAYSGPAAQTRGYISSLAGGERGVATEELQNVVLQQVLDNLKATFGAAPTEGERQILVDIQGSVNKAPEVRKRIFEGAKAAADKRLKFNQERSGALRSGDYYNPGYSPLPATSAPAAAPEAQGAAPAPVAPQPIKAPPAPAIEMLKANPSPQTRQQFDEIFGPGAADRILGAQAPSPMAAQPPVYDMGQPSAYGVSP